MSKIWVVIPAYNESKTIRKVVETTLSVCPNLIVVNDCSTDDTAKQLSDLPIEYIEHPKNKGKAASLMTGFQHAIDKGAEAVITMDGDDQHDANDIPKLIEAYQKDPKHLFIAARLENNEAAPSHRLFANRFADFWVSWAAGHFVQDSQSGFRLYPAELLTLTTAKHSKYSGFVFESEIIINAAYKGFTSQAVSIKSHYPEQRRESHYRPVSDISKTVLMIAGKLLKRGLYLPGLVRSLKEKRCSNPPKDNRNPQ